MPGVSPGEDTPCKHDEITGADRRLIDEGPGVDHKTGDRERRGRAFDLYPVPVAHTQAEDRARARLRQNPARDRPGEQMQRCFCLPTSPILF